MAPDLIDAFAALFIFLQVGAAFALIDRVGRQRAVPYLAALFGVNAILVLVIWVDDLPGGILAEVTNTANWIEVALDVVTLWLILAALAVHRWPRTRWLPPALLAIGGIWATVVVTRIDPIADADGVFRPLWDSMILWPVLGAPIEFLAAEGLRVHAGLFHLAVAFLLWTFARGTTAWRWVALGFLPRALYWATFGILWLGDAAPRANAIPFFEEHFYILAATPVYVWAAFRLLRHGRDTSGPPTALVGVLILFGPLLAIVDTYEVGFLPSLESGPTNQILNLVTLAAFRPLLAVAGLRPASLARMTTHAVFATGVTMAAFAALYLAFDVAYMAAKALGFAVGLAAFGLVGTWAVRAGPAASAASDPPLRGLKIGGRYRLQGLIGTGSVSRVFVADDLKDGGRVAVKLLSPHAVDPESVAIEARVMSAIRHGNVTAVRGVHATEHGPALIMEHVAGAPLSERLAAGVVTRDEAVGWIEGILQGMAAVHDAGVIHRDVKPANILLDADGVPKLSDFHVARVKDADATISVHTEAAVAPGTPRYMSPEQARGESLDLRSDLYSVGLVAFEILAGRPYVEVGPGEGLAAVQAKVAAARPFAADLGEAVVLAPWFVRALDPDPSRRFPSARDMLEAFDAKAVRHPVRRP